MIRADSKSQFMLSDTVEAKIFLKAYQNFREEILGYRQPVPVEFVARWSGACHILAPALQELTDNFRGRVEVCRAEIEDNAQACKTYGVYQLPT